MQLIIGMWRVFLFVGMDQKYLIYFLQMIAFSFVELGWISLKKIQNILCKYEKASGQKINNDKTTLFFSTNVTNYFKKHVKNLLGVSEIKEYEKYLGLLAVVGRNKRASLNYIKDRLWDKLQDWKEKLLSQASKEVLLKVVVQAIPSFTMSCFRLPMGLCHDIKMLIQKFWWG